MEQGDGVDLGNIRNLIEAERLADKERREAEAKAREYTKIRDEIRKNIAKVLPIGRQGLIDGMPVVEYSLTEGFAHARFQRDHPDLAKMCTRLEEREVLDLDKLRHMQPDLYNQYRIPRWWKAGE